MNTNMNEPQRVDFHSLTNANTVEHSVTMQWLVTGVVAGIDMGRMSIASGRRDFGPGISGRHTAEMSGTCFRELEVTPTSPPPFSYLITAEAALKEIDIRSAGDAMFSGSYYNPDETISQSIVEQNRPFLESGNYDGVIRHSAAAYHQSKAYETVHALFPSAINKTIIIKIVPLGEHSPSVEIRWPDGRRESTSNYSGA
jgi:hypothetical protein